MIFSQLKTAGLILLACFLFSSPVLAQVPATGEGENEVPQVDSVVAGLHSLDQFNSSTPQEVIGRGIKFAMGFIGTIALCLFVYAGITWMTGRGNSEKQSKAINLMIWSSLGVIAILSSYAIVQFVFEAFK